MSNNSSDERFHFLFESSSENRVKTQQKSVELLFENFNKNGQDDILESDSVFQKLRPLLSDASTIFALNPVQKEVYHSDSGTVALKPSTAEIENKPVYQGGPVQTDRGFVIHRPDEQWKSSIIVSDEIGVTTSRDILQSIAEGKGPEKSLLDLPVGVQANWNRRFWITPG